jgi:tetratricopeptide (TPR) repeat protein
MADRYTYVPLIGVFLMAAWAAGDATASWPQRRRVQGLAAGAVLAALAAMTSRQLGYWRDGASLFRHALAVTENNWVAHANLFATLSRSSAPEASAELRETVRILAAFAETYDKKGIELERMPGRTQDAIKEFRTAVRIMPDLAGPHYNLGTALARMPGGLPEAIEEFRTAARLKPDFAEVHYNLGVALAKTPGGLPEAIEEFRTAARLRPGFAEAHYNLGLALSGIPGRTQEALEEFEAALKAKPDFVQARKMIERLRSVPQ